MHTALYLVWLVPNGGRGGGDRLIKTVRLFSAWVVIKFVSCQKCINYSIYQQGLIHLWKWKYTSQSYCPFTKYTLKL